MANLLVTLDGQAGCAGREARRQHRQTSARYAFRSVGGDADEPLGSPDPAGAGRVPDGRGGGRPPLVDAAKNGDRDALRALLQKKVDVNAAEADGTTALHWASYRDDLESADLLLRAGAKVNAANDLGATPLWTASQNGSAAMVRRLLEAGANPNAALLAGETPVMVAARSGYPEIVEQLLAKGAQRERARRARPDGADVGGVAEASRRGEGAAGARRGCQGPLGCLERSDGGAAARVSPVQPGDPARGRDGVAVCGARGRSRVGEAPGGCRRQRERCGCLGRQRHGAGRALRLPGSGGVSARQRRRPERGRGRLYRAPRSDHAPGREDGGRAARPRRRSQRSSCGPGRPRAARRTTSISTPHWWERRRSGWPPVSPSPASCACW